MKKTHILLFALTLTASALFAGNDPSIKGKLRTNIQKSMQQHINQSLLSGQYVIFDAVTGKLLRLKLTDLHSGIVKKGDFYVSCADFKDTAGTLYDIDFLVAQQGSRLKVLQSVVHAVKGKKRAYHVE